MYLPTLIVSLVALTAAAPRVQKSAYLTARSIAIRHASYPLNAVCSTPGQLLCHGPNRFALCTEAHTVTWMLTSDGTSCICDAHGDCSIVASDDMTSQAHSGIVSSTLPSPMTSFATTAATSTTAPVATSAAAGSRYKQFSGDGSPQAGWPTLSEWLSFEELFKANQPIGATCEMAFGVPNNQPNDTAALHDALLDQSKAAGIPAAFALAIMLQESLGCVYVDTTVGAVANPGLMQDHDGDATCFGRSDCPSGTIQAMLKQGISGTSSGQGLRQIHQQAPSQDPAQAWYQTARIYNSGSLGPNNSLVADSAGEDCYAPDIANRLIGWSKGPGGCTA